MDNDFEDDFKNEFVYIEYLDNYFPEFKRIDTELRFPEMMLLKTITNESFFKGHSVDNYTIFSQFFKDFHRASFYIGIETLDNPHGKSL